MAKTHLQKLKADDYKNQFELEQISNYFSSSLAEKKTEDEVLWDVAGNLIARMNYVDCMIYLWNEDKTKMIQKAAYGPKGKPEFISSQVFDVLPGQGVVGHVIESRQPVLIQDTRTDSRYRIDEAFRLSEICVPIIHNDELMGIIDSEHHVPGYFSERDIKILTTIATLIGNKLKQIGSEQSLEAKRKELAGINEQLAEAKLSALQAQMNPHFVFNALNSIKRMILDGENEKASRYLSKFALMIRMTLDHSKDTFVTLDENIKYLSTYLEMEQLRFDDSFNWSIITDENTDTEETAIPSLMIQPLVENAIWHGLMQVEGEKKIRIGFTQDQNRITCCIEDNGIGIRQSEKLKQHNHSPHRSVGLENLRNRIKILNEKYDIDCRLEITDLAQSGENNRGTLAVLEFNAINM
jgi:LytS/YehU family sensor histidine kinase